MKNVDHLSVRSTLYYRRAHRELGTQAKTKLVILCVENNNARAKGKLALGVAVQVRARHPRLVVKAKLIMR